MRFHVVALPQSCTTKKWSLCGFSQKTLRFCWMMKSLGHTVFLYGGEENEAPCDEHVVCITREEQDDYCPFGTYVLPSMHAANPTVKMYNGRVATAISARKAPGDFVCLLGGTSQEYTMEKHADLKCVEYGIGYVGFCAPYLVFESNAWRHTMYGMRKITSGPYDTVIPAFYDEDDWPREKPENYVLFAGRINANKGVNVAYEACEKAGVPLKIIGYGSGKFGANAEFLGAVDTATRNDLMARALALICPTQSIEPFGNVACEAQLCGTPVISTDWGGFTETVEDGVTGYRGSTMDDFVEAIGKVGGLNRGVIRKLAALRWSMKHIRHRYQKYFERLARI